jgi:hypothetical protein
MPHSHRDTVSYTTLVTALARARRRACYGCVPQHAHR